MFVCFLMSQLCVHMDQAEMKNLPVGLGSVFDVWSTGSCWEASFLASLLFYLWRNPDGPSRPDWTAAAGINRELWGHKLGKREAERFRIKKLDFLPSVQISKLPGSVLKNVKRFSLKLTSSQEKNSYFTRSFRIENVSNAAAAAAGEQTF